MRLMHFAHIIFALTTALLLIIELPLSAHAQDRAYRPTPTNEPPGDIVRYPSETDRKVWLDAYNTLFMAAEKTRIGLDIAKRFANIKGQIPHKWYFGNPDSAADSVKDNMAVMSGYKFKECFGARVHKFGSQKYSQKCEAVCPKISRRQLQWAFCNWNRSSYLLEYWWPETIVETNNFGISAFNPLLGGRSDLIRQWLETLQKQIYKTYERELGSAFTNAVAAPDIGQSQVDGMMPSNNETFQEAHAYRTSVSMQTMRRAPMFTACLGWMAERRCFYNTTFTPGPGLGGKYARIHGWTEQPSLRKFWRNEAMSQFLDPQLYLASVPRTSTNPEALKRYLNNPQLSRAYLLAGTCGSYRAAVWPQALSNIGADLGKGYADLQTALGVIPQVTPALSRICYFGGGQLFPVTGGLTGSFSPLVSSAYLSRRAIYLMSNDLANSLLTQMYFPGKGGLDPKQIESLMGALPGLGVMNLEALTNIASGIAGGAINPAALNNLASGLSSLMTSAGVLQGLEGLNIPGLANLNSFAGMPKNICDGIDMAAAALGDYLSTLGVPGLPGTINVPGLGPISTSTFESLLDGNMQGVIGGLMQSLGGTELLGPLGDQLSALGLDSIPGLENLSTDLLNTLASGQLPDPNSLLTSAAGGLGDQLSGVVGQSGIGDAFGQATGGISGAIGQATGGLSGAPGQAGSAAGSALNIDSLMTGGVPAIPGLGMTTPDVLNQLGIPINPSGTGDPLGSLTGALGSQLTEGQQQLLSSITSQIQEAAAAGNAPALDALGQQLISQLGLGNIPGMDSVTGNIIANLGIGSLPGLGGLGGLGGQQGIGIRISKFDDKIDRLQRIYPRKELPGKGDMLPSGCFMVNDIDEYSNEPEAPYLQDLMGDPRGDHKTVNPRFPKDLLRPEHEGSVRYVYWNKREACMCSCKGSPYGCTAVDTGDAYDTPPATGEKADGIPRGVPYPFGFNAG